MHIFIIGVTAQCNHVFPCTALEHTDADWRLLYIMSGRKFYSCNCHKFRHSVV